MTDFEFNGYQTNKAELKYMAENWTYEDIRQEFNLNTIMPVINLFKKLGIRKKKVYHHEAILPQQKIAGVKVRKKVSPLVIEQFMGERGMLL